MLGAAKLQMQSHSSNSSESAQHEDKLHALRVNPVILLNYLYLLTSI